MKTPIAITLIISGCLLIASPIVADHLHRGQVTVLMTQRDTNSIYLEPTLSRSYRFACWFTGSMMAASAIVFTCRRSRSEDETREAISLPGALVHP